MTALSLNPTTALRLRWLTLAVPGLALLIIARLFYWQVVSGPRLAALATRQHQNVVVLTSQRGDILDRQGELLAGTQTLYHLFAYKPQLSVSPLELAARLAPILAPEVDPATESAKTKAELQQETQDYLLARLSLESQWVSLKHYLSPIQKQALEAFGLTGLGFEDEPVRFYPEASLSAHILGFVGADLAGQPQGYFGLEGFFDRQLRGREGKILTEKDARGNPILIGRYNLLKNVAGRSLTTTLDKHKQYLVEAILKEGLEKYQAKAGRAIVMEVKTGEIIAMASFPNYDPGNFALFDKSNYKNANVADLFEPGSIFKILVMAAALNEGVVAPDSVCDDCAGPLSLGEYTIKTWDDVYHPGINMTDVLVHSDNIGMVYVARRLGKDLFIKYLANFGLGKPTGIELQEETTGQLKSAAELREIDLATNSFGQGIAVTPLQILAAANAIANNGVYIQPTLVRKMVSSTREIEGRLPVTRRVITSQTAQTLGQMMVEAVERGEAKWAKPKNLSVAGKTGTAQVPIRGHYDQEKTIASFIGFFPAANPRYSMLVSLTEPQTSPWGSETAAPLWFRLALQLSLLD